MAAADHEAQGNGRVQMTARDMADGEGHGDHGEPKCQRDPEKTDPHVGKRGGKNGAPASPRTNQNVPMNSAASFL